MLGLVKNSTQPTTDHHDGAGFLVLPVILHLILRSRAQHGVSKDATHEQSLGMVRDAAFGGSSP
jgi:hypothetical protein